MNNEDATSGLTFEQLVKLDENFNEGSKPTILLSPEEYEAYQRYLAENGLYESQTWLNDKIFERAQNIAVLPRTTLTRNDRRLMKKRAAKITKRAAR